MSYKPSPPHVGQIRLHQDGVQTHPRHRQISDVVDSSLPLRSPTTVLRTLREDALDDARQACGGVAVAAHGEEQADAGQRVATYCTASATSRRRVELPTRTHSSASPLPLGPLRYTGRVDGGMVTRHTSWRS